MNPITHLPDRGALAPEVGVLNALLRSELAAVAAYEQALAVFADRPAWHDLQRICLDHRSAAALLRDQVVNLGGEPVPAGLCDSAAGVAGSAFAIDALRAAEERRLAEIERVLEREQLPDECRFAIRAEVLPHCHEHIDTLAALAGPTGGN